MLTDTIPYILFNFSIHFLQYMKFSSENALRDSVQTNRMIRYFLIILLISNFSYVLVIF